MVNRTGLGKREQPVMKKDSDNYYANAGSGVNRKPFNTDESDLL